MNDMEYAHFNKCINEIIAECRQHSMEPAAYCTAHPERDPVHNWDAAWTCVGLWQSAELDLSAAKTTWTEYLHRLLALEGTMQEMGCTLGEVHQCLSTFNFIAHLQSALWMTEFEREEIRRLVATWNKQE